MTIHNHFVPQLILRRFDEKINTYRLSTKELKIDANFKTSFSSPSLYTQEIEDLFSGKIESEFARILDKKIRSAENVVELKRLELATVKKYLLLAMLRTNDGEHLTQHQKEKTAENVNEILHFQEKNTENLTSHEYWMRTLQCIIESMDLNHVRNHPQATNLAVRWASTYNSGYLSIWDSTTSGEDFIVIDNGMTSEHEITRFTPPFNDDVIKRGYLLQEYYKYNGKPDYDSTNKASVYLRTLFSNDFMTENVYLFSVTRNRMLVIINPFFRLFDKEFEPEIADLAIPDVWPTRFVDHDLFKKNNTDYVNDKQETLLGLTNINDKYIYPIRKMILNDVIYANCLTLDRISDIFGFCSSQGITRSLAVYSQISGLNDYSDLINQLEAMGYVIKRNAETIRIRNHISPTVRVLNNNELKYANNVLELKHKRNHID